MSWIASPVVTSVVILHSSGLDGRWSHCPPGSVMHCVESLPTVDAAAQYT